MSFAGLRHNSRHVSTRTRRRFKFEALEARRMLTFVLLEDSPVWSAMGPSPMLAQQNRDGITYRHEQGGAVQAVAVHPSDRDILYVATINGGVWRTDTATYSKQDQMDNDGDGRTDEADEVPRWRPLTDRLTGISTSEIVFDPLDTSGNTLYAGRGHFSSLGFTGTALGGLLKTTDAGKSWTEIERSTFASNHIYEIVPTTDITVTGQSVFASASKGIYRSQDGGQTWGLLGAANGLPNRTAQDLIVDPQNAKILFAAFHGNGIYRTDDGGDSWSNIAAFGSGPATNPIFNHIQSSRRIELAASVPNGVNVQCGDPCTTSIYAGIVSNGNRVAGIYAYSDSLGSWTRLTNFPKPVGARGSLDHFAFEANPANALEVIVAGVSGSYVSRSNPTQWTRVSPPGGHADFRDFSYDLDGNVLSVSDGGIWRLVDPSSSSPRYESLNGNLQVVEVNSNESVGYDPLNDIILVGTQDNGGVEQIAPGSLRYLDRTGGDGNSVAVGVEGDFSYRYMMANNYTWLYRNKFDATNKRVEHKRVNLASPDTPNKHKSGLVRGGDAKSTGYDSSIRMVSNKVDPKRLLLGTGNGLYESKDRFDTVVDITPGGQDVRIRSIAYGGTANGQDNAEVVYAGTSSGLWLRTSNQFAELTAYPGSAAIQIATDPIDFRHAYVLDSNNRIWRTLNAGQNWRQLTADLSGNRSLPAGRLFSIEFARPKDSAVGVLLAGTDDGVHRLIDPSALFLDRWRKFGFFLPNAITVDVHYDETDDLLLAGTIGRGVFSMSRAGRYLPTPTVATSRCLPPSCAYLRIGTDPLVANVVNFYSDDQGTIDFSLDTNRLDVIELSMGDNDNVVRIESLPESVNFFLRTDGGNDTVEVTSSQIEGHLEIEGGTGADVFSITPSLFSPIRIAGEFADGSSGNEGDVVMIRNGEAETQFEPGEFQDTGTYITAGAQDVLFANVGTHLSNATGISQDGFEPNESREAPFILPSGSQYLSGLTIDNGFDEDWFQWEAFSAGTLSIELDFDHDISDLDLELFDQAGNTIAISNSTDDDEHVQALVEAGQTYFLRVDAFENKTHPDYKLSLSTTADVPRDRFEPNDSSDQATDLGTNDVHESNLSIQSPEIGTGDDWYTWRSSTDGTASFQTLFRHDLGDLDLALFDSENNLLFTSTSVDDNESITWFASAGDVFHLRVYGVGAQTNPFYEVVIEEPEIAQDYLEGNNQPSSATKLSHGTFSLPFLTLHEADEDWLRWEATQNGSVEILAEFTHEFGDVDVQVVDEDLNQIGASLSTSNEERITLDVTAGNEYLIRVYASGGTSSPGYSLSLTGEQPIPLDELEPNNTLGQAFDLGEEVFFGREFTLHGLDGQVDEDWYRFQSAEMGPAIFTIESADERAIQLEIRDSEGNLVTQGEPLGGRLQAELEAFDGSVFLVRVSSTESVSYTLSVDAPEIQDDYFEPNDNAEELFDLGMGDISFDSLTLRQSDEDWFSWTAGATGPVNLSAAFDFDRGAIAFEVFDENLQQIGESDFGNNSASLQLDAQNGDSFLVRLFESSGQSHPGYSFTIDGPDIVPDRFEANDTIETATEIEPVNYAGLSIHEPRDEDWLRWMAPADGTLSVTISPEASTVDLDVDLFIDDDFSMTAESESADEAFVIQVDAGSHYALRVHSAITTFRPSVLHGEKQTFRLAGVAESYNIDLIFEEKSDLACDYDGDGCSVSDIDLMILAMEQQNPEPRFDLDDNGVVEDDDITIWLELASEANGVILRRGDTNLDGAIEFDDFLKLSSTFGQQGTTWSDGNSDGKGGTDFADFLRLSANFGL